MNIPKNIKSLKSKLVGEGYQVLPFDRKGFGGKPTLFL